MSTTEQIKFNAELIFNKFQAISINTKQLSTVIPRSEVSLRRDRIAKIGIPYTQFKMGAKGKNVAMFYEIAKYMINNQIKTAA